MKRVKKIESNKENLIGSHKRSKLKNSTDKRLDVIQITVSHKRRGSFPKNIEAFSLENETRKWNNLGFEVTVNN